MPLWWDEARPEPRAALGGDRDVDVAIVGGGYTGLWTALELARRDPALRVMVIEREHVGFGASGRNGGWCYDGFAASLDRIEAMSDLDTARRFGAELRRTVHEVGKVVADEGIDAEYHAGGSVEFLTNGGQLARARRHVAEARHYGWNEDDLRLLGADEALEIGRADRVRGGLWSAHTAAVHPAKLAWGLAEAAERRGVEICERTAAAEVRPRRVKTTDGHEVRADVVVLATEAYTAELPGHHRDLAPLYSLMIATEPLPDHRWAEIGLSDREMFGDLRHLVTYGQRTADGRVAFGGRGAPYRFGSGTTDPAGFAPETWSGVRQAMIEIFPQLADVAITHRWGGVLGVTRTWMPRVRFDPASGFATAGGYVGAGVAAANMAGRTLADLIVGADTDLTAFPWVGVDVRRWPIEPMRWLGINAALAVMASADRAEFRTDRPARRAAWLWKLATR